MEPKREEKKSDLDVNDTVFMPYFLVVFQLNLVHGEKVIYIQFLYLISSYCKSCVLVIHS